MFKYEARMGPYECTWYKVNEEQAWKVATDPDQQRVSAAADGKHLHAASQIV